METFFTHTPILFLDIETVPQFPTFGDCPESVQAFWTRKAENLRKSETETAADIYNRAGIYAEFGRIICISFGFLFIQDRELHLKIKSIYGDDEKILLEEFANLLNKSYASADSKLCAHNGKEFDYPYIARRMVINKVALPAILNTAGKKPWEVNHLDTLEMWKFGDYKNFTPLNLLTHILDVPSPKDDIDGSQVWSVYWLENDLPRIVRYCEKDVEALANVYLRMKGTDIIPKDRIVKV
jgi:3'-5' exonuclease